MKAVLSVMSVSLGLSCAPNTRIRNWELRRDLQAEARATQVRYWPVQRPSSLNAISLTVDGRSSTRCCLSCAGEAVFRGPR